MKIHHLWGCFLCLFCSVWVVSRTGAPAAELEQVGGGRRDENLKKETDLLNVRNELRLLVLMRNERKKSFDVFENAFARGYLLPDVRNIPHTMNENVFFSQILQQSAANKTNRLKEKGWNFACAVEDHFAMAFECALRFTLFMLWNSIRD